MKKKEDPTNKEWPVIYSYTRAQAIVDGVLIDVTALAQEAGFKMPVAITNGVYSEYVAVPDAATGQDEEGRLWDVLWMLQHAIRSSKGSGSAITFKVLVQNSDDAPASPIELNAVCGPGDNAEPVITVMLPGED